MAFPPAFLDELVARNPIEDVVGQYVQLKRSGSNLFGLCPFHGEKTASFSVSPSKQICYCFGCHKGGGVINFIMEIENLSYPDAVRFLAKRVGMEVPEDDQYQSRYKQQERLWKLCRDAARYFHNQLKAESGEPARAYLARRGTDAATVTKFGMGYAPSGWQNLMDAMQKLGYTREELLAADLIVRREKEGKVSYYDKFRSRIIFPLIDVRGNVLGFAGRALDNETKPKYTNTGQTEIFSKRRFLFAMNLAKKSKQGRIILCEGPMDAIACHQYGFDCAVASQGTSLTEDQVNLISKYTDEVVMTYDSDSAGQNATQRAITMLEKAGVKVRILQLKDAKDADEFLHKFGADAFTVLLQGSEDQADYRLQQVMAGFDLTKDDQRVEFSAKAAELIAGFSSAVEREIFIDKAAKAASITPEAMQMEVKKAYKRRMNREKKRQEQQDLSPAAARQPRTRGLRYDNLRSALAEETILCQLTEDPSGFDLVRKLTPEMFSVPLFGRVYAALRQRHDEGLTVSFNVLQDLTAEEAEHLSYVRQKQDAKPDEKVLRDCAAILLEESQKAKQTGSAEDLLELQAQLRRKKGYGDK